MSQQSIISFFSGKGAARASAAASAAASAPKDNSEPLSEHELAADTEEPSTSSRSGVGEGGGEDAAHAAPAPKDNRKDNKHELADATTSTSKKSKLSEPPLSAKQAYEAKRKRTFQEDWRDDYDFVGYDSAAHIMYCTTCRLVPQKAKGNSLFHGVTGDSIRRRTLRIHAGTQAHRDCQAARDAQQNPQEAPIACALHNMDNATKEKLIKLFNIAYFIAREEASFTMFPKLVRLHALNGLNLGLTYRNDQACRTFVSTIGQCMYEELVGKIQSARFFSIMSDSSMDRSILDQELIYITYLEEGLPVTHLVNIVTLQHAHSDGILEAILSGLENVSVTRNDLSRRLVGFGSDGASVMQGVQNGVAVKLREICPSLVSIWCVAHRLELTALDTVKHVPLLSELKDTLKAIHKHYTYSAKATRELKSLGEALGTKVVKPGNVSGCRWLPHMCRALEALVTNYRAIVVYFENLANDLNHAEASVKMRGRAKVVHKSLTKYKMVKFVHVMLDVLQELKVVSLLFQKDGLSLQDVTDGLHQVAIALVQMQMTPGPKLQKFLDDVGPWPARMYMDVALTRGERDDEAIRIVKDTLIDDFNSFLTVRFGNLEGGIFKAAETLFNHTSWPDLDGEGEDLATFGVAELNIFMTHFHHILNECNDFTSEDATRQEWQELKVVVQRHFMHVRPRILWQRLMQGLVGRPDQFTNIQVLLEVYMVFPMNSACCERGFSCVNRVKSDWRSSLSNDMLNYLLQISIHGPEEYNTEAAVTKWWAGGRRARRPDFKD
ncbi:zinc finger protein 862-like [Branchiostoma floridae x Branchiostoma belcheri]